MSPQGSTAVAADMLQNYVDGAWTPAASKRALDVTNPATGETLAHVPLSNAGDVEAAVAAARRAFPGWRSTPVIQRAQAMFDLRAKMVAAADELALSITTEMGKTLVDARAEVGRAIEMVESATAVPMTMQGRVLEDVAGNVDCETVRQPVGVCAAIVPFNFPAMVPFWFLPFALACGNTFVIKPSEQVPTTLTKIFELIDELDLPPGVVNLVNGDVEVANALIDSPEVDAVSFVGSAPVAREVYRRSAANGKRVQALGGAKNFMVVLDDAHVTHTVRGVIGSAFGAAGQRCMAGSVLLTVGDAHYRVVQALCDAALQLSVGDGTDEGVDVGPVISAQARERIEGCIERAVEEGADILVDGRGSGAGSFVGPTILDNVTPDMAIAQEEVFGPVLCVMRAKSLEDAIGKINASPYGNGTSLFTESAPAVRRFRHDVEVGMIGVNIGVAAPVAFFPFSGWKGSFMGDLHAHGTDAIDFYTRKKTVTSRFFTGQASGAFFTETATTDVEEEK
ncbi:MAG TPA: CoA-acylating methylmalonate-semialdehyde dehydrogenase [Solirubrobacterales bacterium]